VSGVVVRVRFGSRRQLRQAYARDLEKGRIFLRTDTPLPVGSSVPMVLELHDGQAIDVHGEVVASRLPQLATADQPAGMQVRLVDFGADKRARVEDLLRRSRTQAPAVRAPSLAPAAVAVARPPFERMLGSLRRLVFLCADASALSEADYYEILGVSPTATTAELREACSVLRALVDPAAPPDGLRLPPAKKERLERVHKLVVEIERTMTDPAERAEYDAVRFGIVR
jgi:Tfp pilus assembly protein PilZ